MIVQFKKELYEHLLSHSLQMLPEEACGLLLGESEPRRHATTLRAQRFAPLTNHAANPQRHFELNPAELLPYLMDRKHPVIGLFHSHPAAPAIPSQEDLQTLWHSLPSYWILSLQQPHKPDLQLFQIKKATSTTYHKLAFAIDQ
ncbi:M67 family metallopeptidase [Paenibacillus sp. GCM10023248]|uniref:M67 family metallopeptidase n=1 Tax=unclassified Paenibacillus TaxID=185978 RepID=UPI0023786E6F|nr:M67 family metallopeptidase [Paenibacillus sp. MAHUQ-63]MDD9265674.1 M67 family metallopeptidase [Paenibacillus sp. MAHUQ-63]